MVIVFVALVAMLCVMLLMMFVKEHQAERRRITTSMCEASTDHQLKIHAYDRFGELYHRCRCGMRHDYADCSGWCSICADPKLERHARQVFFRKTA